MSTCKGTQTPIIYHLLFFVGTYKGCTRVCCLKSKSGTKQEEDEACLCHWGKGGGRSSIQAKESTLEGHSRKATLLEVSPTMTLALPSKKAKGKTRDTVTCLINEMEAVDRESLSILEHMGQH